MKNKKIIQIGAITVTVLISLYLVSLLSSTTRGFVNVETSVAMTQLKKNNVTEANIDNRDVRECSAPSETPARGRGRSS